MSDTQNSLKNTVKNLNQMVQTKTGRNTIFIVLATLIILFILYYLVPYAFRGGDIASTTLVDEAITAQSNMS